MGRSPAARVHLSSWGNGILFEDEDDDEYEDDLDYEPRSL